MVTPTLGWSPTCFVARNVLELLIFLLLFLCKHWDCSVTVLPAAQFMQCWRQKPGSVCSRQALSTAEATSPQLCSDADLSNSRFRWLPSSLDVFSLFSSEAEYKRCTVTPSLSSVFLHWGVFWAQHWLFDALVLLLWNGRFTHAFPRRGDAECSVQSILYGARKCSAWHHQTSLTFFFNLLLFNINIFGTLREMCRFNNKWSNKAMSSEFKGLSMASDLERH